MRQEPHHLENGIYTPVGMTAEQAHQLFSADLRMEDISYGSYQQNLLAWENMWAEDPRSWADYKIINEEKLTTIKGVAERWNHPASGMSDYEVAVLLIANLHQESRLRRANPGANAFGNQLGRLRDLGGDLLALFINSPSLGSANLRPIVVDEMLGETLFIPMPEGAKSSFTKEQLSAKQVDALHKLSEKWQNFQWNDHRGRMLFLFDDKKAIELMAINFYRGVQRISDLQELHPTLQPTMFNMSAWLSQGIAESGTLRTNVSKEASDARRHAIATVHFVNAIIVNKETFGMSINQDDVILFNDDDFLAYLHN